MRIITVDTIPLLPDFPMEHLEREITEKNHFGKFHSEHRKVLHALSETYIRSQDAFEVVAVFLIETVTKNCRWENTLKLSVELESGMLSFGKCGGYGCGLFLINKEGRPLDQLGVIRFEKLFEVVACPDSTVEMQSLVGEYLRSAILDELQRFSEQFDHHTQQISNLLRTQKVLQQQLFCLEKERP